MCKRHEDIKIKLGERGSSFRTIARELNVSHTSVITVSRSQRRSKMIEKAIADKIGRLPQNIWPEKYKGEL